ncbi:hypothetical protein BRADI_1g12064v3 [Brachypodium distachyon]|uniref:PB1 domain-containing protein n=1 Tax=Brachypodium distachyon TaxID=15368 RepID=A0A0Q3J7A6_BRADI|nr:hypothetical protein BRADI_1g12064v3 [Brachypodium distachyon]
MAAERSSGVSSATASPARLRMMCSHGGRFLPSGPDGAIRYAGGETRVLVVPRDASFRELLAKLAAMAGGYRLAEDEDVLVSATCDEELAHMRDEHDRLRATRPSAVFRLFFSASGVQVQRRAASSGRPPLAPKIRRVQSEQSVRGPCSAAGPVPMRRVQSAQQLAGCSRFQPCCHRRHDQYAPVLPAPPTCPPQASKNARGARPAGQEEPAPEVSGAEPADRVISTTEAALEKISGEAELEEPNRRAFWEFE